MEKAVAQEERRQSRSGGGREGGDRARRRAESVCILVKPIDQIIDREGYGGVRSGM